MKKALIVATVFRFLNFEKSDIQILLDMGYEVHIATNMRGEKWLRDDGTLDGLNITKHQIDFGRVPFSKDSIKSYKEIKKLIRKYNFDVIHCHTPVAAAITRIAARKAHKHGTYIIYTCHGFHFNKKSDKKSWMLYYPIEKFLASFTDMIITINKEDSDIVRKFNVKKRGYIPGVGVDTEYIATLRVNRKEMFAQMKIPEEAFVILTIGELSDRKNQKVILNALGKIKDKNIYYIMVGTGKNQNEYTTLIESLGISNNVIFTGQKEHDWVMRLCHIVDLGAIPSTIEGLGLAGLELLAAGTPLIGSDIQGIKDYLINDVTGISCNPNDVDSFANAIIKMKNNREYYDSCKKNTFSMAQNFDIHKSRECMKKYYEEMEQEIISKQRSKYGNTERNS